MDLEETCVELSLPQPLLGSAPTATTILVVDCPKPWNSKIQASSGFPEKWKTAYEESKESDFTLIGRNGEERDTALVLRRFKAQAFQREVAPANLPGVLASEGCDDGSWQPAEPCLFVCTHGSRDSCCGRLGVPILQAARAWMTVHECSHLGGHRFAPTLLSIPEWRFYGRLPLDQVEDFCASLKSGDTSRLPWLRGSGYADALAQVVEGEWVRAHGQWPDDARLLSSKKLGNTFAVEVELHHDGAPHRYQTTLSIEIFRGPASCSDVPIGLTKDSAGHRLARPLQLIT